MRSRGGDRQGLDGGTAGAARRWARAAVALVVLLAAGEARAARLRVLVLVPNDEHRELAARIKGQTADLDAAVATAEGELPPTLDGQIAAARVAAARADVVVWFAADANGWIAYIARGDRVLVRRIGVAPGALSRSASNEAVALAVRTALRGFAASADSEGEGDQGQGSAPVAGLRPWGELGGTGLLDGTRSAGQYGVALRGGAARGRWHLGVALAYQPAATIDGASASIKVERQQAGLVAGADLVAPGVPAARWALALEVAASAARYRRVTTATAAGSGLVPTPAAVTWSPVLSTGLRGARRVASRTWLALELGADVVPRPPQFGVERSGGFDRFASVWALQPRLALSLLVDWR